MTPQQYADGTLMSTIMHCMSITKSMKNQTYELIADLVNYELSKSTESNFSRFRQIDKKLKLPVGSSYEISGWKDLLDYESKTP